MHGSMRNKTYGNDKTDTIKELCLMIPCEKHFVTVLNFANKEFCCQIVATQVFDCHETLILCGFQNFSHHSHSTKLNTFCIISVHRHPSGCSDSLWYSYSPAYTAFCYHLVITMITKGCFTVAMYGFHGNDYTTS